MENSIRSSNARKPNYLVALKRAMTVHGGIVTMLMAMTITVTAEILARDSKTIRADILGGSGADSSATCSIFATEAPKHVGTAKRAA